MSGQYPEQLDPTVYALRAQAVKIGASIITPSMMEIIYAWWAGRKNGSAMINVSEPSNVKDEIRVAPHAWHLTGVHRTFSVAAETGHRITKAATQLGHKDTYGIALGDDKQATLVVASHAIQDTEAVDHLIPTLVQATHEQLDSDRIHLRLPLHLMLASNES